MSEQPRGNSYLHPAELHESPGNPRRISDERFEALCYALEKAPQMMEPRPIIATLDAEVIAGNMRKRAATAMLAEEGKWPNFRAYVTEHNGVPVWLGDLTDAEKREWMLRDNQGYGEYVHDELAALMREHQDAGDDMALLGFEDDEVKAILSAGEGGGSGDGGGGGGDEPLDVWGVVVDCQTESEQAALLEELADRGLNVRALL